jgi:DNA-binding MarR family transcriptional regulator
VPEFLELHSKTTKALRAATDAALQHHGLRLGQDHLLAALWEQDGRTPGEVAAAVNVSTPAVTKMATRLADAGLIVRRDDDHDHRLVRLWLTDAGSALRLPVQRERRRIERAVTADLSDTERRELIRALTKVHQSALDLLDR